MSKLILTLLTKTFVENDTKGYAGLLFTKNRLTRADHVAGRPQKAGHWHGNELSFVDSIFIIAFPCSFAAFNLLYWPVFLSSS